MRVHILSDLHLDFGKLRPSKVDRDVTIIAGDAGERFIARNLIDMMQRKAPVLYVPGNHEYWHSSIQEVEQYWSAHGTLLQKRVAEVNGYKIAGCTLWTNFRKENPLLMLQASASIRDYERIKSSGRKITPAQILYLHKEMVTWLSQQKADIIVTHHAPSYQSIDPEYIERTDNDFYASDLEWLVSDIHPKLWIHGHIHASMDYMLGDTRVICNPRGYVGYKTNKKFNPDLVIEI